MAGNYFSPFSLRISEELLEKIKFIASNNKRSANKEIEFILENAVKDYEKQNGEISIPND
ncbi:MAG: Arc family DNA-binding protein [Clostridia bacterium]|nr:Arc family DNA-binding protein [Clostridia bacterium]